MILQRNIHQSDNCDNQINSLTPTPKKYCELHDSGYTAGWFGSWLKTLKPIKKSGWALFESIAPHLPMVKQNGSQNGIVATNLQLARGCELVMESGMTVACCTEVCVSCCHAGGRRICWVPDGQACCKVRMEGKQRVSNTKVRYISSRRSKHLQIVELM